MRQKKIWYKVTALILVLVLLMPVVAACSDDDDDETPSASTSTAAPAKTTEPTKTAEPPKTTEPTQTEPVSTEPVKLGVIFAYSGPLASYGPGVADPVLEVVRRQIEDEGGVLGGRPVKIVIEDNKSQTAYTATAATKLITDDNVSAIVWGGTVLPEVEACADVCMEYGIPLFTHTTPFQPEKYNPYFLAVGMPPMLDIVDLIIDFMVSELKPKRVAILASNLAEHRGRVDYLKEQLEPLGVEIVLTEYVDQATTDMTPHVTQVKYADPDVLIISSSTPAHYLGTYKAFMELGGKGDIKIIGTNQSQLGIGAHKMEWAVGAYTWVPWAPGIETTGGMEYERAWFAVHSSEGMMTVAATLYEDFRATLAAIEMAGSSDPEAIWEVAKSGRLEWDGLTGPTTLKSDGTIDAAGVIVEFLGNGELAVVWPKP